VKRNKLAGMDGALSDIRVSDAMHHGIVSCPGDTTLGEVARIMASERVHAVAITTGSSGRPVGVVSDREVVAAIASGAQPTAGEVAVDSLGIAGDASLRRAAQTMAAEGVAHLLVKDAASGFPIGVISSLDIASVYAGRS
jgi:CBS domain-containing protein